jgi:hypothetical protein
MKEQRKPVLHTTIFVLVITLLPLWTTACGGGTVTIPRGTPDPNATPDPKSVPTPTASPVPTATPVPTPTPPLIRRATPVPGPSPTPWSAVQGPTALTTSDVPNSWASNVYGPAGGHRYMMVMANIASTNFAKITWVDARTSASQKQVSGKNGHLVTINSLDEQRLLMSTFDHAIGTGGKSAISVSLDGKNPIRGMAIGAIKNSSTNNWQWITGEPFPFADGYGYWISPSEPTGDGNYLHLFTESLDVDTAQKSRYGWNDYFGNDSETFGYIVEFE